MTPLTKFWATISQEIEPEISCGLLEKVAFATFSTVSGPHPMGGGLLSIQKMGSAAGVLDGGLRRTYLVYITMYILN